MRPRVWWAVFALRCKNALQYRTAAWAGVCTQFAWGFMLVMLYQAFYRSNAQQSMQFSQLVSYVWLQQAFFAIVNTYARDGEIGEMVISGQVAYELCRPQDLYFIWYARLLAQRFAAALLRFPPVVLVALLLPQPYGLLPPASPWHLLLFLLTLALACLLITAISMIMHTLVFKLMNLLSAMAVLSVFAEFLSGDILPVPFMPPWLRAVSYCLPFRYCADLPFRVYSGSIGLQEAALSVGVQLFWILLLGLLGHAFLSKQLKNVVVQGG